MRLRDSILGFLLLSSACPGKPQQPISQPVIVIKKETQNNRLPGEIVVALTEASDLCTRLYTETEPERLRTATVYDTEQANKDYEYCRAAVEKLVSHDPSMVVYTKASESKGVDVPDLKAKADQIPARIEEAKLLFAKRQQEQQEALKTQWTNLLTGKGDRLKIFEENGQPTASDATGDSPEEIASAKTWIYYSRPFEKGGKQVIEVKTFEFKKNNKLNKKTVDTQEYQ
jgi:hypothetical protein